MSILDEAAEGRAGPAGMDGKRKVKLECPALNAATLAKLEQAGLVAVSRGEIYRPKDATAIRAATSAYQSPLTASATCKGDPGHIACQTIRNPMCTASSSSSTMAIISTCRQLMS